MKLWEIYKDYFALGAAVNHRSLHTHADLLSEFNSLTAESSMKFECLHPQPGEYDFTVADELVSYAKQTGKQVRGHTLVWHNQTPEWVFQNTSREKLLSLMQEHIRTVCTHFGEAVYCWDVVNEAVEDKRGYLLRKSPWQQLIGDKYIDLAYRAAHEAAPHAQLYYNDYNEFVPEKRNKILQLLRGMLARGVPLHGAGLQGHWSLYEPELDEIRRTIEAYAGLGLRVQVTELDVGMFRLEDKATLQDAPTQRQLEWQAERYGSFFALLREYKSELDAVTLWGVADDDTWLSRLDSNPARVNWPLLFDAAHKQKPAYRAVAGPFLSE